MREVYADNSATTRLSPAVLEKMTPYLTEIYGNPSSIYRIGGKAKEAVEAARENIAKNLGAERPGEMEIAALKADGWYKVNCMGRHTSSNTRSKKDERQ